MTWAWWYINWRSNIKSGQAVLEIWHLRVVSFPLSLSLSLCESESYTQHILQGCKNCWNVEQVSSSPFVTLWLWCVPIYHTTHYSNKRENMCSYAQHLPLWVIKHSNSFILMQPNQIFQFYILFFLLFFFIALLFFCYMIWYVFFSLFFN